MKKLNDLHIHTNYSDGEISPLEVLCMACKKGAEVISITDHDCVKFYFNEHVKEFISNNNIKVIPGVELFCIAKGVPVEILAYGFDVNLMQEYLSKNAVSQKMMEMHRYQTFLKIFKDNGIDLNLNEQNIDFNSNNPGVSKEIYNCVLQNNKAKNMLLAENENVFESINMFLRYTINNPKSRFYGFKNSTFIDCKDLINMIHNFKGLAFLAHPYEYLDNTNEILMHVLNCGIDGIECIHFSNKNKQNAQKLLNFCEINNLLISGGSDFHTLNKNSEKNKLCEIGINDIMLDKIINKLNIN